jgi:protein-S-isoprenylcysteine O-methyltransferase Ste14
MDELKVKILSGVLVFNIVLGLLIFLPAWTILYWQGWIYLCMVSSSLLFMTGYFLKHDPALMERRINIGPKAEKKTSQKISQSVFSLLLILEILLSVIDHRHQLSHVPMLFMIIAYFMILVGMYIFYRVFNENSFASATIEVDKDQPVISTGPYSIVRHPMYAGAFFVFMFTPLALDSLYGMIPAAFILIILIFRTLDEENFLNKDLSGYPDYCKEVKFRLIPYIW